MFAFISGRLGRGGVSQMLSQLVRARKRPAGTLTHQELLNFLLQLRSAPGTATAGWGTAVDLGAGRGEPGKRFCFCNRCRAERPPLRAARGYRRPCAPRRQAVSAVPPYLSRIPQRVSSASRSLSPFMVKQLCLGEAFLVSCWQRRGSGAPPPPFTAAAFPAGRGAALPSLASSGAGCRVSLSPSPEVLRRWPPQVPQGPA